VSSIIRTRYVQWNVEFRSYLCRKKYPNTEFLRKILQQVLDGMAVGGLLQNESRSTKRQLKLASRYAESYQPEWEKMATIKRKVAGPRKGAGPKEVAGPKEDASIIRWKHNEIDDRFLRRFEEMQLEVKKLIDDSQLTVKGLSDQLDKVKSPTSSAIKPRSFIAFIIFLLTHLGR